MVLTDPELGFCVNFRVGRGKEIFLMTPFKTVLMQRLVAGLPPELGEKGFRMKSRNSYLFVIGKRAKNNFHDSKLFTSSSHDWL